MVTRLLVCPQTWILYTSEPIALTMGAPTPRGVSLTASGPFTGVMRVALTTGAPLTAALHKYANIWPAEAGITATVSLSSNTDVSLRQVTDLSEPFSAWLPVSWQLVGHMT